MTVYAIMPVHDRLALTRQAVQALRSQRNVDLRIIVIDDGSTDDTATFLAGEPGITTLKGDGTLWWGGAMDLGLRHIHALLRPGDYFLFVNNDTTFNPDFVASLVTVSQEHDRAAVGSIVRDAVNPRKILTIGARADFDSFRIWDIASEFDGDRLNDIAEQSSLVLDVDLLPGRGTLFPGEVLDKSGYMRPWLLPHYRADYEFSDRARRSECNLRVATTAALLSHDTFGTEKRAPGFWQRNLGKGSPDNRIHTYIFFSLVGTWPQRLTAVPRLIAFQSGPVIRHWFAIAMRHINRAGRGLRRIAGLGKKSG